MEKDRTLPIEEMPIRDRCCKASTGCKFKGSLKDVVGECIFVDKVYDSAVFNLQGIQAASRVPMGTLPVSRCGPNSRITRIFDIRTKKYFNPNNINDCKNLNITPNTTLSGAQFVLDEKGNPVVVPGPAGLLQYLIYTDTSDCDKKGLGTPIFGSQEIFISGMVIIEMDIEFINNRGDRQRATIRGRAPINQRLTNFFELCMPSVIDSAFLPQFAEFCNVAFTTRLATQNISRDISFNPSTGEIYANFIIALCITCEKKIKVPVQLCVLSTGFCEQEARTRQICGDEFPPLFPPQVNEPFANHSDCE
ncbi:MAG: hypothetical protein GX214_08420 [Clostridiales bacterium]|nr:hypothetical protein [Clostridiales bacterium]